MRLARRHSRSRRSLFFLVFSLVLLVWQAWNCQRLESSRGCRLLHARLSYVRLSVVSLSLRDLHDANRLSSESSPDGLLASCSPDFLGRQRRRACTPEELLCGLSLAVSQHPHPAKVGRQFELRPPQQLRGLHVLSDIQDKARIKAGHLAVELAEDRLEGGAVEQAHEVSHP